ncbi:MAG: hypothetical protein N3D78_02090 [Candidatus Aenigmarchaeota archaeon]|nr:hypothetical protein [Candidatus Aenigmarchaeota archaeon]
MVAKKILMVVCMILFLTPSLAQSFQLLEKSCQGNYIVAKVRETDGNIGYRVLEFCPSGCMYGVCLAKREIPSVVLNPIYEVRACEDNVIFVDIKNEGTKGDVSLSVEGEIKNWIRVPTKISLYPNESKSFAMIVSVPCNVSGIYQFTLIGSGATNFYAPSALKIVEKGMKVQIPITTSTSPINVNLALILSIFVLIVFIVYKVAAKKRKVEEKFS